MNSISAQTRRAFLGRASQGLGGIALASLMSPGLLRAASRGVLGKLPLPQKAKRVIWLTMAGGPSQLELFDYKPKLAEMDGKPMPESFTKGQQLAQLQGQKLVCKGPMFGFAKHGKCQMELSELLPHLGSVADDICLVRSMTTDAINHDPAHMFMNTGTQIAGPSQHGLMDHLWTRQRGGGSARIRRHGVHRQRPHAAAHRRAAVEQRLFAVEVSRRAAPLAGRSRFVSHQSQRRHPRATRRGRGRDQCAEQTARRLCDDPEIATRIAQYEMAFQMQASVPELMDIRPEGPKTLELYGCTPGDGSFASNCLLARRLAERGTRFIQLYHRDWDHHSLLREELPLRAKEVDRACMALITDLKQRGMFDDTLIVFSGEFGRTPMAQGNKGPIGRDHHNKAMSMWLAGAGIQRGLTYGATDDLGYAAQENITTVHDLHATMLHQLGIQHDAFSFKFQGLDARLSGVEGAKVIKKILV
jgi:hypothetical protein